MSLFFKSSNEDRTDEFHRWRDLAQRQLMDGRTRHTDEVKKNGPLPTHLELDERLVIENSGDDLKFYEAVKAIFSHFDLLTSMYPLETDNTEFQCVARQLKEMLQFADSLVSDHSFAEEANDKTGKRKWWNIFDVTSPTVTFSFDYHLLSPEKSFMMITRHRKVVVETLQNQLLAYLQGVEQIRKEGLEYKAGSYRRQHQSGGIERRKRLSDLLKSGYSMVEVTDETRRMVSFQRDENDYRSSREIKDECLMKAIAGFSNIKEDIQAMKDRSILLSAKHSEIHDPAADEKFLTMLMAHEDPNENIDRVIYSEVGSVRTAQPAGDFPLPSSELDAMPELDDEGRKFPLGTETPGDVHAVGDIKKAHPSNERLQLDDLITTEAPLLQIAHQKLNDVSSMLTVFVDHITQQADQAVDLLQTTEASTELITDSIFQLKEAIKRTESRQLYFVLLFAFMSSTILSMDLIL